MSSSSPRRYLRIPAVLGVAALGATTTAVLSFSSCSTDRGPEPVDANKANSSIKVDAAVDSSTSAIDSATTDTEIADAVVVVPADAYVPPPDAYVPPPDAPVDAPHV
jgi:hypothetical protein